MNIRKRMTGVVNASAICVLIGYFLMRPWSPMSMGSGVAIALWLGVLVVVQLVVQAVATAIEQREAAPASAMLSPLLWAGQEPGRAAALEAALTPRHERLQPHPLLD